MIKKQKFYLLRLFLLRLLGRELYERLIFRIKNKYWPHLRAPRTYNEKICNRKLFKPFPGATMLADKYAVRDFVAKRVGSDILNKVYFIGSSPDAISLSSLPKQFVIKATNGSGDNLFVRDKDKITLNDIKAWHKTVLKRKFGLVSNERWYLDIEPRIMIEEWLEDSQYGGLPDYKFYCFDGKAIYVQVDTNRYTPFHKRRYFNMQWEPFDVLYDFPEGSAIDKPKRFDDMKIIAEKLSAGSDYMRVDLYCIGEVIRFGEITLSDGGGWDRMVSFDADLRVGALWKDVKVDPHAFQ